jgi:hypothetical protein
MRVSRSIVIVALGILVGAVIAWLIEGTSVQAQAGAQIQSAAISFAGAGANSIVTGCASTTRVYKIFFTTASATTITFKNGTTAVSGAMSFGALGAGYWGFDQVAPHIVATAGHDVILTNLNAVQVSGAVWYACTNT